MQTKWGVKKDIQMMCANSVQNLKDSNAWKQLQQSGLFENFTVAKPSWSKILEIIDWYLQENDPVTLLSALFQIAGVWLPLQQHYIASNTIHQQLVDLLSQGKIIAAHCMTEKNGGTDIFSMHTRATLDNNSWLINGEKTYVCNAPVAEIGLLYAASGNIKLKPYNLSCFLVKLNDPGIITTPLENLIGLKNLIIGTIKFQKHKISSDMLIGKPGLGHTLAFKAITFERLIIPLAYIGLINQFYQNAASHSKVEIYRLLCSAKSLLLENLSNINVQCWQHEYIKLGCLTKWHVSECYIAAAKLSENTQAYLDARSSWIYSGTNDSLKHVLMRLL